MLTVYTQHSHEKFVTSVRTSLFLDNPLDIADPIFALLGNAAARYDLPAMYPASHKLNRYTYAAPAYLRSTQTVFNK
jgi:hypothetical protein